MSQKSNPSRVAWELAHPKLDGCACFLTEVFPVRLCLLGEPHLCRGHGVKYEYTSYNLVFLIKDL